MTYSNIPVPVIIPFLATGYLLTVYLLLLLAQRQTKAASTSFINQTQKLHDDEEVPITGELG